MSAPAPNKQQRTSINGWTAATRPSPDYRSRLEPHSPSPSPSSSGKRVVAVAGARKDRYENMMDGVTAVTAENSAAVAAMRAAHAQALAAHYSNQASSSSISSNSMVIDPRAEFVIDPAAEAEAANLRNRIRQREVNATRPRDDSQKYARQEEVRARAKIETDPYNAPEIPRSRKNVGKAYREPEYHDDIVRYMIEMDVSCSTTASCWSTLLTRY